MDERIGLREYLTANIFDGSEAGTVTIGVSKLLDEVCENYAEWVAQGGDEVTRMTRALQEARVLHDRRDRTIEAYNDAGYPQAVTLTSCRECGHDWPCPTVIAMDG